MSVNIIYVTFENENDAERLIEILLNERLIAGANYFPIRAMFWWAGMPHMKGEWAAILQTHPDLWEVVRERVEQVHPYEVPCIIRWSVDTNAGYAEWIDRETAASREFSG